MNAKIYLDSKPDKDGNCQLYCQITGKGKRAIVYFGIKVFPDYWINGAISKKEPNSDLKNLLLQTKWGMINRILVEAEMNNLDLSPLQVKNSYQEKSKQQEQVKINSQLLTDYFDLYEAQYKNIQKHNTIRGLKQVKDHITKFDANVSLSQLNQTWLVKYCSYLVGLELEDSTIKDRHLKAIKAVVKEARRNGINVSEQVDQFRWKSQPKQPFFATWGEVEAIQEITDFIQPIQERIRDLFLLSCYTGLRDSDLKEIRKENIYKQGDQSMLQVRVVKTGFDYAIPLSKTVESIFRKYNFEIRTVSQQEYNRTIKHIAHIKVKGTVVKVKNSGSKRITTKLERWQLFTTHTGRRTFGRRFLDKGGSLIVLSKIYGHKNIETTLKYIGYQPQEVISEFRKVFG